MEKTNQTLKEVMKLENGDYAVKWGGSKKWCVIKKEDELIVAAIVSLMINHK